ncbi:galactokinase [Thermoflavifilum thermophilum]|uniref:Galactokinase n=1 Tax=Thermoflavifilum thermophilum TaxID=1393122 RepID=A0A1I7NHV0_9BACT|nr:galactokinase [Thermoflavifilum thermophilum]SFV34227.1 galactokinase [Thermoflavifilum thermophilum]
MQLDDLRRAFLRYFQTEPLLIVSPGRVNLIGEHTDYNEGYVMPGAIDKAVLLAIAPSGSDLCEVHALNLQQTDRFHVSHISQGEGWQNYVRGVVYFLQQKGYAVQGFYAMIGGDIPMGSGLSSSAALEGAFSFGLHQLFGLQLTPLEMAFIGQQAEHHYVGVRCGIMDQYANIFGRRNQLIRLDCRSLQHVYLPFDFPDYSIVLCNSMVHHSLASSAYNERRRQCEEGVSILKKYHPEVKTLRDASPAMLHEHIQEIPPQVYMRCMYVVEENERVLLAGTCLQEGDLEKFGDLMYASHIGLQKQYEVSCEELDYLVELTMNREDVIGARMMGGGFGGCTINIVHKDAVDDFKEYIVSAYEKKFHRVPEIYVGQIVDGVHVVD